MKVVHVLKRIEMIDDDIKELRKLEKTIARDKSFSTPIYLSIEKQINIMLGDRNKLLELQILNPPENYVSEIEGSPDERIVEPAKKTLKKKETVSKPKQETPTALPTDVDDIPMLTQDMVDNKFNSLKKTIDDNKDENSENTSSLNKDNVKILDIALEKNNMAKKEATPEKKVKFFRDNFPID